MVDGLPGYILVYVLIKIQFKTQRIMKGGKIIFVLFLSLVSSDRQTDSNLYLISTIKITTQSFIGSCKNVFQYHHPSLLALFVLIVWREDE